MDRLNWVAEYVVQANIGQCKGCVSSFILGASGENRFIDHIYIVRRLSMNRLKQERDESGVWGAWKWVMII